MQTFLRSLGAIALVLAVLLGTVGTASAAHNGNNKAALAGTVDPNVSGQSVVNYREGTGTFNAKVSVTNLPEGTYSFFVRSPVNPATPDVPGVETLICTDEASAQGTFSCAEQGLRLPGFVTAVVRDASGMVVASGTYDRRGNCRDPQQAGTQCEAPGQH